MIAADDDWRSLIPHRGAMCVLDEVVARGAELHRRDIEEFQRFPG